MHACIREVGRGFFDGERQPSNTTTHLRDPPPPLDSRIDSGRYSLAALSLQMYAKKKAGVPKAPADESTFTPLLRYPASARSRRRFQTPPWPECHSVRRPLQPLRKCHTYLGLEGSRH